MFPADISCGVIGALRTNRDLSSIYPSVRTVPPGAEESSQVTSWIELATYLAPLPEATHIAEFPPVLFGFLSGSAGPASVPPDNRARSGE